MLKKCFLICSLFIAIGVSIINKITFPAILWLPITIFICSYVILTALFFVFAWIVSLNINVKKEYEQGSKFHLWIFNHTLELILNLAHVKVITKGLELVPQNKKYMLVFNHKSNFDPMIQSFYLQKSNLIHVSKMGNFNIPIAGPFIKRCGYLAIDRENPRNALKTICKAIEYIKSGKHSVGISPEGTRNFGDGLLPFHSGSFKIVQKAECPLVICSMKNTEMIKKNFPFKRTTVIMNIVKVFSYEEIKDLNTQEISDLTRKIICNDLNINEESEKNEVCAL